MLKKSTPRLLSERARGHFFFPKPPVRRRRISIGGSPSRPAFWFRAALVPCTPGHCGMSRYARYEEWYVAGVLFFIFSIIICHLLNGDEGFFSPSSVRIVARPYGLTKKNAEFSLQFYM